MKRLVSDLNSLPFGIIEDKYDNIWIAQHVVDKLGIYDPHKNDFSKVDIPSRETFTQFVTADDSGNIWFVEQRGNKLGSDYLRHNHRLGWQKISNLRSDIQSLSHHS